MESVAGIFYKEEKWRLLDVASFVMGLVAPSHVPDIKRPHPWMVFGAAGAI